MMKKTDLREKARNNDGEYVFGAEDTGSHACYMIYPKNGSSFTTEAQRR